MRCRQCHIPVVSTQDPCPVCGRDPKVPLPEPPPAEILGEALRRCTPAPAAEGDGKANCPPLFHQLIMIACSRSTWLEALSQEDLSAFAQSSHP